MGSVTTVWWCWMYLLQLWSSWLRLAWFLAWYLLPSSTLDLYQCIQCQPSNLHDLQATPGRLNDLLQKKKMSLAQSWPQVFVGLCVQYIGYVLILVAGTWTNIFLGKIWSTTPSTLWSFTRLIGSSGFLPLQLVFARTFCSWCSCCQGHMFAYISY